MIYNLTWRKQYLSGAAKRKKKSWSIYWIESEKDTLHKFYLALSKITDVREDQGSIVPCSLWGPRKCRAGPDQPRWEVCVYTPTTQVTVLFDFKFGGDIFLLMMAPSSL